jgi:ADP-ribose pyrophosphatase
MILHEHVTRLSPWLSLVAKDVLLPGKSQAEQYHCLRQADYVSVLAVTHDGRIPLVRQYRPAVARMTMELPGGLRDGDDAPDAVAVRELMEETGLRVCGAAVPLGSFAPDTGRLENRIWAFFAHIDSDVAPDWTPERGVECLLIDRHQLREFILDGRFDHALHIAVIGLAVMRGVFRWD